MHALMIRFKGEILKPNRRIYRALGARDRIQIGRKSAFRRPQRSVL